MHESESRYVGKKQKNEKIRSKIVKTDLNNCVINFESSRAVCLAEQRKKTGQPQALFLFVYHFKSISIGTK